MKNVGFTGFYPLLINLLVFLQHIPSSFVLFAGTGTWGKCMEVYLSNGTSYFFLPSLTRRPPTTTKLELDHMSSDRDIDLDHCFWWSFNTLIKPLLVEYQNIFFCILEFLQDLSAGLLARSLWSRQKWWRIWIWFSSARHILPLDQIKLKRNWKKKKPEKRIM